MRDEILTLASSLCSAEADGAALDALCRAACGRLDGMLADGVTAEDCREQYILAAAWMVADWLQESKGCDGVTSLSAGDLTVRRESGSGGRLEARALELMAPWLKDRSFVFRGVRG